MLERLVSGSEETRGRGGKSSVKVQAQRSGAGIREELGKGISRKEDKEYTAATDSVHVHLFQPCLKDQIAVQGLDTTI